jgi:ketosteroid isomerase-like protein
MESKMKHVSHIAARFFLAALTLALVANAAYSQPKSVSAEEQQAVLAVIRDLYDAYNARDLDKVMALEHQFVEAQALAYEKRKGPGKGDEMRDALRGVTEEILKSRTFAMKPLQIDDVEYRREGDMIVVSSAIPIIATEYVEVEGDGTGNKARIRIAKFWLKKTTEGWRIEQMDLHG